MRPTQPPVHPQWKCCTDLHLKSFPTSEGNRNQSTIPTHTYKNWDTNYRFPNKSRETCFKKERTNQRNIMTKRHIPPQASKLSDPWIGPFIVMEINDKLNTIVKYKRKPMKDRNNRLKH